VTTYARSRECPQCAGECYTDCDDPENCECTGMHACTMCGGKGIVPVGPKWMKETDEDIIRRKK
jgi:hypothetical protein